MKTSLYEEIVAAMREGNSKKDIIALINEAEDQIKEEQEANKAVLDESRANFIDAAYDFYKLLGLTDSKAEVVQAVNLVEELMSKDSPFMTLLNTFASPKSEDVEEKKPETKTKDLDLVSILDFIQKL